MQTLQMFTRGWQLQDDSPFWRIPVRPVALQDNLFRRQFDYTSVIYDVFFSPDRKYAVCICPPFFNLKSFIVEALFAVTDEYDSSQGIRCIPTIIEQEYCAQIWIPLPSEEYHYLVCESAMGSFRTRIGENHASLFQGKRVLLTKQQDNKLDHIADWIAINQALHGINAVLIFDNNSQAYSVEQLLRYLADRVSLDVLAIVTWPYPFGPAGGGSRTRLVAVNQGQPLIWDSNFMEPTFPQVGHWRFCAWAEGVISCDIDEVILAEDLSVNLFEQLAGSPDGALLAPGHFVTEVTGENNERLALPTGVSGRNPSDFFRYPFVSSHYSGGFKYLYAPQKIAVGDQLNTHHILKADGRRFYSPSPNLTMAHFTNINNGWKISDRVSASVRYDPTQHYFDCTLVKALLKAEPALPGHAYPYEELIAFARKLGACPRPHGVAPAYSPATDCSLCPFSA